MLELPINGAPCVSDIGAWFRVLFCVNMLAMEARAFSMLGKCSATELHTSQPQHSKTELYITASALSCHLFLLVHFPGP
jgi:hypothetical protein